MAGKIQSIFRDHWHDFLEQPQISVRKVVKEDVDRMMNCGDLKKKAIGCTVADHAEKRRK